MLLVQETYTPNHKYKKKNYVERGKKDMMDGWVEGVVTHFEEIIFLYPLMHYLEISLSNHEGL
jgi:hypothetical protein